MGKPTKPMTSESIEKSTSIQLKKSSLPSEELTPETQTKTKSTEARTQKKFAKSSKKMTYEKKKESNQTIHEPTETTKRKSRPNTKKKSRQPSTTTEEPEVGHGVEKMSLTEKEMSLPETEAEVEPVDSKKQSQGRKFKKYTSIPAPLVEWCKQNNAQCIKMIKQVILQTSILSINFVKEREGRASYEIVGASEANTQRAAIFLQTHLRNQVSVQRLAEQKAELESFLDATQQEIDAGLRVEFSIPQEMLGIAIGAGGSNVNRVIERTGVDKIVIDNKNFVVRIVGPTRESVAAAREQMEFAAERIEVSERDMEHLSYNRFGALREIQHTSRLFSAGPLQDSKVPTIELLGTKSAVETATMLLKMNLDYNNQCADLAREQREIKSKLRRIDAAYGYHNTGEDNNATRPSKRSDAERNSTSSDRSRPKRSNKPNPRRTRDGPKEHAD